MMLEILIGLVMASCITLFSLYFIFRYNYNYWKRRGIRYIEPEFPYGNAKDLVQRKLTIGQLFRKFYNEMPDEKMFGTYILNTPILIVKDPELLTYMLKKDFNFFQDRGIFHDEKRDPVAGNLFLLNGESWRNLRRKLSPAFSKNKINICFPMIMQCCDVLKRVLEKSNEANQAVDIKEVLKNFTLDVIATCAFGVECNAQEQPDNLIKRMSDLFISFPFANNVKVFSSFFMPTVAKIWPASLMPKSVENFFLTLAKHVLHLREERNISRNDLMQLLIDIRKKGAIEDGDDEFITEDFPDKIIDNGKNESGLTVNEIAAQMLVFQIAGFETSSSTLTFLMYEIARNEDVQRKMQQEIDEVLVKYNGKLSYDLVHDMPYTDMVIDETLRKYPIVGILNRECLRRYLFPNTSVIIEPGTKLLVPLWGLHYDEKYFKNPNKFDPERFSEENKKNIPQCVYMPFGDGPRFCIGMRFAFVQMKSALVTILSEFDVKTSSKEELIFNPRLLPLTSLQNIYIQLSKRVK